MDDDVWGSVPLAWCSGSATPDEAEAAEAVAATWKREFEGGREFARGYNTPENRRALIAAVTSVHDRIGPVQLEDAFARLKANGRLATAAHAAAAAKEREASDRAARREKYAADCAEWTSLSSTSEIKRRVESDPAYRSWFKSNAGRIEPAEPLPLHPDIVAENRRALAAEEGRLGRLAEIPQAVREFAEEYKRLPAAEAKRRMATDPGFSRLVETAAGYNLI